MKNDEKAAIAGAGVLLTYFFINKKNKEKKTDISDVSIYPTEFYV